MKCIIPPYNINEYFNHRITSTLINVKDAIYINIEIPFGALAAFDIGLELRLPYFEVEYFFCLFEVVSS